MARKIRQLASSIPLLSSSAKADDPVLTARSVLTGCPACAGHDDQGVAVPSFADLVVIARNPYPIPSRTRPSKSSAPMVLSLKAWKSRSLPGLPRTEHPHHEISDQKPRGFPRGFFVSARDFPVFPKCGTLAEIRNGDHDQE